MHPETDEDTAWPTQHVRSTEKIQPSRIYVQNTVQNTVNVGFWLLPKGNPHYSRTKFERAENINPFSSKIDRKIGAGLEGDRKSVV